MSKDRFVLLLFTCISNLKLGISDSLGQIDNARARGLRQALFYYLLRPRTGEFVDNDRWEAIEQKLHRNHLSS